MDNEKEEGLEIDIKSLFKYLFVKAWIILVSGILVAIMAFSYVNFFVPQKYKSTIKLYVNTGATFGSISVAGISASQSLVKTYIEILKTNDTLDSVRDKAKESDTSVESLSNEDLLEMISTGSVNSTEILYVTITDTNKDRSKVLAETISNVLLYRITAIISNASVEEVDDATDPVAISKGTVKYSLIGFLAGCFIACCVFIVLFLKDHLIHDEDFLLENYDIPLLAVIPDLSKISTSKHGNNYYKKYANSTSQNSSFNNNKEGNK